METYMIFIKNFFNLSELAGIGEDVLKTIKNFNSFDGKDRNNDDYLDEIQIVFKKIEVLEKKIGILSKKFSLAGVYKEGRLFIRVFREAL